MTLKIGLIGTGGIAGPHVNGYLAAPEHTRLVAMADVDADNLARRSAEAAEGGQPVTSYTDCADLLADPQVEAVDICLPHHLHADAIIAAAQAGKHVICEKPLGLTTDQADSISAAVAANGVTLMCAHNQLYLPTVVRARELITRRCPGRRLRDPHHRQLLQRLRPRVDGVARREGQGGRG